MDNTKPSDSRYRKGTNDMNKIVIATTLGLTLLLAGCWPQPKPTPTPTPTPIPTTAVKITEPATGARVDPTEMVKGTSQKIPEGQAVWVVVFVPKVGRYYPQNNAADVQANGDWASVSYFGVPSDVGLKLELLAVLVDHEGQNAFTTYLADARDKKSYPGLEHLPLGVTIYDRVSVTRK